MKQQAARIINRLGLHARAATRLVNCASSFSSQVWLQKGDRKVNAKSIMGVLTLAAPQGSKVLIMAEGQDADVAIDAIASLIRNRFDEQE